MKREFRRNSISDFWTDCVISCILSYIPHEERKNKKSIEYDETYNTRKYVTQNYTTIKKIHNTYTALKYTCTELTVLLHHCLRN